LQILEHARAQLALIFAFADPLRQSLGGLIQYRQSHCQMKPVQEVLSLGIQIQLHVAYVLAAVGEEIDLLVGLHALGLKQLEQATLGLGIVAIYKSEAFRRFALLGHTLTHDHLEPSFGSRLLVFCMDITAVDSNDKRGAAGSGS